MSNDKLIALPTIFWVYFTLPALLFWGVFVLSFPLVWERLGHIGNVTISLYVIQLPWLAYVLFKAKKIVNPKKTNCIDKLYIFILTIFSVVFLMLPILLYEVVMAIP